jgi:alpha-glucosidase (family GH31 glycosyl hydrolase)
VVHVDAPLDKIPLFVRAGSCLPMLPGDVDSLITERGFTHDADVVTLADRADAVRHIPVGSAHC